MGRDRETGPDPLTRLAAPAAEPAPWGVTGMPSWLDTQQGRQAWAAAEGFDCLDENADREIADPSADADGSGDGWDPHDDLDAGGAEQRPGLESLGDGDDWEDDWEPPRRRLTMLPPAAIGLIAVGLIAAGIAGYSLLKQNQPVAPLVAFDSSGTASAAPSVAGELNTGELNAAESNTGESGTGPKSGPPPSPRADGQIVVSVVGLVHRPGLVRIPNSARVADAIDRAGGARPGADLISLNLAQLLRDGDQILVGQGGADTVKSAVVAATGGAAGPEPVPGPPAPRSSSPGAPPAPGNGLVDLNSATAEQLEALPGLAR